jgi:type VI secretion system protein ImpB
MRYLKTSFKSGTRLPPVSDDGDATLHGTRFLRCHVTSLQEGQQMDSFQREIPKSRVSITLDLHTGGAQKKVELPLKLLVAGDFSAGKEQAPLAERKKTNIDKNNFDAVLSDLAPELTLAAENTLAEDGSELPVALSFRSMKDFEPEQVARQIPELQALLAMRNLLRDLKSNLLDNGTFRREFEKILKDRALSQQLRGELAQIATAATQPEGHT